jgi:hypothetical protein
MIKQAIDGKTYNTETARCLATVELMGYHRRRHAKDDHHPQCDGPRQCCMAAYGRVSQQHSCSFDHLIGAGEQRRRNVNTQRAGGLQIDQQFEFG